MSTPARRAPLRTLTVTAEVDVDLDEDYLRQEGWVYVGTDPAPSRLHDSVMGRVEQWHEQHHSSPWPWCTDDLCSDVQRTVRP